MEKKKSVSGLTWPSHPRIWCISSVAREWMCTSVHIKILFSTSRTKLSHHIYWEDEGVVSLFARKPNAPLTVLLLLVFALRISFFFRVHYDAVLLVCVSVKFGFLDLSRAPLRRPEGVYTTDRCVVYTYVFGDGGADELEAWRTSWSAAGWKPMVLTEEHAALHPKYEEYKSHFLTMPTINSVEYETGCFLRHVAMAVVGGGTMTDYDVVNVNVPPSPNCDFLPNDGALTTHENFIPSIVSGDENAFNGKALGREILDDDE